MFSLELPGGGGAEFAPFWLLPAVASDDPEFPDLRERFVLFVFRKPLPGNIAVSILGTFGKADARKTNQTVLYVPAGSETDPQVGAWFAAPVADAGGSFALRVCAYDGVVPGESMEIVFARSSGAATTDGFQAAAASRPAVPRGAATCEVRNDGGGPQFVLQEAAGAAVAWLRSDVDGGVVLPTRLLDAVRPEFAVQMVCGDANDPPCQVVVTMLGYAAAGMPRSETRKPRVFVFRRDLAQPFRGWLNSIAKHRLGDGFKEELQAWDDGASLRYGSSRIQVGDVVTLNWALAPGSVRVARPDGEGRTILHKIEAERGEEEAMWTFEVDKGRQLLPVRWAGGNTVRNNAGHLSIRVTSPPLGPALRLDEEGPSPAAAEPGDSIGGMRMSPQPYLQQGGQADTPPEDLLVRAIRDLAAAGIADSAAAYAIAVALGGWVPEGIQMACRSPAELILCLALTARVERFAKALQEVQEERISEAVLRFILSSSSIERPHFFRRLASVLPQLAVADPKISEHIAAVAQRERQDDDSAFDVLLRVLLETRAGHDMAEAESWIQRATLEQREGMMFLLAPTGRTAGPEGVALGRMLSRSDFAIVGAGLRRWPIADLQRILEEGEALLRNVKLAAVVAHAAGIHFSGRGAHPAIPELAAAEAIDEAAAEEGEVRKRSSQLISLGDLGALFEAVDFSRLSDVYALILQSPAGQKLPPLPKGGGAGERIPDRQTLLASLALARLPAQWEGGWRSWPDAVLYWLWKNFQSDPPAAPGDPGTEPPSDEDDVESDFGPSDFPGNAQEAWRDPEALRRSLYEKAKQNLEADAVKASPLGQEMKRVFENAGGDPHTGLHAISAEVNGRAEQALQGVYNAYDRMERNVLALGAATDARQDKLWFEARRIYSQFEEDAEAPLREARSRLITDFIASLPKLGAAIEAADDAGKAIAALASQL